MSSSVSPDSWISRVVSAGSPSSVVGRWMIATPFCEVTGSTRSMTPARLGNREWKCGFSESRAIFGAAAWIATSAAARDLGLPFWLAPVGFCVLA